MFALARYLGVGVVNTAVGLAGIYLLMLFGVPHLAVNAFGCPAGVATSYALNG